MSDLYMMGASTPHYFSKVGICRTTDLHTFDTLTTPQVPFTHVLSGTTSISGTTVMSTSAGGVITTQDFNTYNTYDFNNKANQIQKLLWNQAFVAVGYTRDHLLREQAQVWISGSAADTYSWPAAYVIQDDYSAFTNLTTTVQDQILAVGHAQSLSQSVMVTGSYDTVWAQIALPAHVQGGLWSITCDGVRVWIGGRGWVAQSTLTDLTQWVRTDLPTHHTVTHMQYHDDQVWAVAGDQIYLSTNGYDYQGTQFPGRSLTVTHVHDGQLVLGSHSLLTQTDVFVWSGQNWQAKKSQVHAYAFVSI